jgi:F420-non-reducing hydrogenase iron-sulfur subunit
MSAPTEEITPTGTTPFEPKVVAFLCNWCAFAGADKSGAARIPWPPSVRILRIMCGGRMDLQFVSKAWEEGADGVIVLGCHPGDCHYREQNCRMIARHRLLLRYMQELGIPPDRCRLDFVSASEGEKFARVLEETVDSIRKLGPFGGNSELRKSSS